MAVLVVWDCPPIETLTFSPGEAFPQTGLACSRWSTMWSPKILGRETSAWADRQMPSKERNRVRWAVSSCILLAQVRLVRIAR